MKLICLVLALATVISAAVAVVTNYCDKSLCHGSKHIACGHSGKFSTACPRNAAIVKIDDKIQKTLLEEFNKKRNLIAGGGQRGYKPACRMATMEWDKELAKLAELNVMQCKFEHDCHSTKTFPYSIQNLYSMSYTGENDDIASIVNSVDKWYSEVKDSSARLIRKFMPNGKMTGHFLAIVLENNNRVGCAASTYQEANSEYTKLMVACNFATSYYDGSTIYTDCPVPAKNCITGKNPQFSNLCSTSEVFSVNHIYLD